MKKIFLLFACASFASAASAQTDNNSANAQRMERIEHDLTLLQRQVGRGDSGAPTITGGGTIDGSSVNQAQLEVRLSNIEDQIRELRGKTEESQFQVRKLSETLDKFQQDTDFRFRELTPKPAAVAVDPAAAPGEAPKPLVAPAADAAPKNDLQMTQATPSALPQTSPSTAPKAPAEEVPNFASPREHYNYAFRLLNETKYEQSAAMFDSFTQKYPKDPLVGNAYYWGGETFYIRHDYAGAADHFRQGFEILPDGPKAADNLLKLAMSLDALKRDKDACVVLGQISAKFKKKSASVTEKAEAEYKRIGCK